ncbi:MAG TPA: HAD family hydrolase [Ensifer sp.]|jgi:phosphoglycolate phosphatase-like HAD superfamily hydrolase|uniref:HAD family hydrolase n=1 Tax=Ensifer sp. TaxID=1872086 RepID=UPI002E13E3DE|nr:HAD family hydrolase [Ensifer sp.]
MLNRRTIVAALFLAGMCASQTTALAQTDPLPSWNEGKTKSAILDFVRKVTQEGGPNFVKPAERIATFDNDGTLWAEQPAYFQLLFAIDEIKQLAPSRPDWKGKEPFRSILAGNIKGLVASGEKGLLQVVAATHAGMTTSEFDQSVAKWLATARHPTKKRPYTEMVYQPQLELLAHLRANGFKTFIVSGGGVEFMRGFAEKTYGIPPEQVVGSSGVVKFRMGANGKPELFKEAKIEFIDDNAGKPVGINRFIGRRPILAFGNSDGDLQMLQYTVAGDGPRLALIVHHTDAEREWAYDRTSRIGKLDKALDEGKARGWTIVDMKADWKTVFPPER